MNMPNKKTMGRWLLGFAMLGGAIGFQSPDVMAKTINALWNGNGSSHCSISGWHADAYGYNTSDAFTGCTVTTLGNTASSSGSCSTAARHWVWVRDSAGNDIQHSPYQTTWTSTTQTPDILCPDTTWAGTGSSWGTN